MLSKLYDHFLNRFWPLFWKYRHVWDKDWADSYASEESLNHPHRKLILEAVRQFEPFEIFLEYGCGPGANLALLADKYPKSTFIGVDISRVALGKAIKKANIFYFEVTNVPGFNCDIALTDACMIYARQGEEIASVIKRHSKAFIGCEWHDEKGTFGHGRHWVHNYRKLFPGCELRKLTWNDWQDDGWSTYGHIITWKK